MANDSGKFKRYIMSFSYQERKVKELACYKQRVRELKKMDIDQIDMEYINLTSEYEHQKNVLTIFMVSIAIACLMNVWKYLYIFLEKAVQYAISYEGNKDEIAIVIMMISLSAIGFMTFVIFAILIRHTKKLRQTHKELLIVGEIRNKRKDKMK